MDSASGASVGAGGCTIRPTAEPTGLAIKEIGSLHVGGRNVTVSGFDIYGQAMSEVIATGATQSVTVSGKKAFYQVSGITISGSPVVTVSVGTGDVFGCPVRFTDRGYLARVGWDNTLAEDAATVAVAVTTTATTTTGDVRGTVAPSSAADGAKRLVVAVLLPAIAAGPNATRNGALGVTQA